MIKNFCDACKYEIVDNRYARVRVDLISSPSNQAACFDLCEKCTQQALVLLTGVKDTHV